MAVDYVLKTYREGVSSILDDLRRSVIIANQMIHEYSRSHPELRGMGTTCTAAVVHGGEAYLAHVGDSRAYLIRNGEIRQRVSLPSEDVNEPKPFLDDARKKAVAEDKPIVICYTGGAGYNEPLGVC
jgi:anthranilate phosphoribosyltransferase